MPTTNDTNYYRDTAMDALIYSVLFYILSDPTTYKYTSKIMPKLVKDRTLLHALVYFIFYFIIRLILKR